MTNPFYCGCPLNERLTEIKAQRVDREDEIATCRMSIVDRRQNVLLYGSRGVGKTFLLRLLEEEITKSDEAVYCCRVAIPRLSAYGLKDEVASFPRIVLLQLCASLWTGLLGKPYLDLRDRLDETGEELHLRKKDEVAIQRVYKHLMLRDRMTRASLSNTVGFSAGVKGEKKEESIRERRQSDVLPFEFAEFTQELVAKLLNPYGKERVVILCDEVNMMPLLTQEEILDRHLALFSARGVQFLFVAGVVPWARDTYMPSCFETRLELRGFSKREHVQELIEKTLNRAEKPRVAFRPEAVDVVYEAFEGHARNTILACAHAFDFAQECGAKEVTARTQMKACRIVEAERRSHENYMRNENDPS